MQRFTSVCVCVHMYTHMIFSSCNVNIHATEGSKLNEEHELFIGVIRSTLGVIRTGWSILTQRWMRMKIKTKNDGSSIRSNKMLALIMQYIDTTVLWTAYVYSMYIS